LLNQKEKVVLVCCNCKAEKWINKKLIMDMPSTLVDEIKCPACKGKMTLRQLSAVVIK
jgi:hypothetical protein